MELPWLKWNYLTQVTRLFTGQCHLWNHLFKMGLVQRSICEWNELWNKWNSHIQLPSFGCSKASSLHHLLHNFLKTTITCKILHFRTVRGFNIRKMGKRP